MKASKTITKKDLAETLAEQSGVQQQTVKDVLQRALDYIVIELGKGNRFEFRDFGVLEPVWRKARRAQNPKTLVPCDVPARRVVKFKEGRLMRETLARGDAVGGGTMNGAAGSNEKGAAGELKLTAGLRRQVKAGKLTATKVRAT